MVNQSLTGPPQPAAMRRLAALVLILALATPATAQQKRLQVVATPTAAEAGLRGGEPPAEAEPEAPPPLDFSVGGATGGLPAGLAFTRPLDSTATTGGGTRSPSQCRTACAQSYYFCLAEEDEASCNPRWSRCVAGCS